MSSWLMISSRLQTIEWKAFDVCISSTANCIASRSSPRRMHFWSADTQAIAGRPFLVFGIIGVAPGCGRQCPSPVFSHGEFSADKHYRLRNGQGWVARLRQGGRRTVDAVRYRAER
jgi:hypothetical protein